MSTLIESVPQLLAYKSSLLSLTLLCLMTLVQSFLSAPFAFVKQEQVPGMPLNGGHELFSFRVLRTYANSIENIPMFAITLFIAILMGVSASIVNWISIIYLVARLAFWVVYYSGIGKAAGGPRSLCYVVALVSNIVLVGFCLNAFLAL